MTSPRLEILRLISVGWRGRRDLEKALTKRGLTIEQAKSIMQRLARDGLVMQRRGGYYTITSTGRAMLPSVEPTFARGEWKPPVVQRRAGSLEFLRLPSVAAGIVYERPSAMRTT